MRNVGDFASPTRKKYSPCFIEFRKIQLSVMIELPPCLFIRAHLAFECGLLRRRIDHLKLGRQCRVRHGDGDFHIARPITQLIDANIHIIRHRLRRQKTRHRRNDISQRFHASMFPSANRFPRRSQLRIIQIHAIENLIVIVTRRRFRTVRKRLRSRALEQQDRRIGRRKLRMQPRVIKRVIVVRQHLHGRSPRTSRANPPPHTKFHQTPTAFRTIA